MPPLTPLFLSKLINLANKGVESAFMPRCHSCEMPRDLVQSVCNLSKQKICKLRHVRGLNSITCLVSPHISLGGVPTLIWLETSFIFLINYTEPPNLPIISLGSVTWLFCSIQDHQATFSRIQ